MESDTPTHCTDCGEVIRHRLTLDGRAYVADAVTFGGGDPDTLRAWLDAYAVPVWGTYSGECSRCLDADAVAACDRHHTRTPYRSRPACP